ncbi:hypothetical protein ACTG9Q_05550 [Actinokineospora sp. 24-640]
MTTVNVRHGRFSTLTRAVLVAAALTCGLACAPGIATATTAEVGIDFRVNGPGDWPWEILPIPPK